MRVLVAGGSGAVGRLVVPVLATRHTVRVMDLSPPRDEPFHGSEFFHGSVTDPGAVERAAEGQDAVVYLAMGRKTGWREGPEWVASHFAANVTGTYVTLQGCAAAGVRRAVYAGSMSVFTDYTARDYTSSPEPDATDAYGLTKRLGEQVCEAAAVEHGLAVTVLRLVGPMPDEEWHAYGGEHHDVVTAGSDVAAAFLAALERAEPGHAAYTITGDHERRVLDWSPALAGLGWQPLARRER
ncbi:NAD-dependent epimerase/dehydratase family protein [Nonomuraea dietziae]|uniref:Nucleoside-diphosphate-sugar epimerase n=1 Tax=Nonomuraea dietziae TaxID=65515 RepID=A0A7W5Y7H1_9ACTN|nr:NAD(P)-dependent oxidoreductase [Nonomuraea dietziae]MBB3727551.1 nucleoside-diphosphate-sugar epimerase [Nonomuraea dietziae]